MPDLITNFLSNDELDSLIEYLNTEDDRSDIRPDVSSKHPRWDIDEWPQHIVERGLSYIFPKGYVVEEVTFQDTKIGLKPHTDNGSIPGTVGKTVMFLLDAEPEAQTIFFNNYWNGWRHNGVFFTKQHWTPFQYKLPGKDGNLVYVEDIRILLQQCEQEPETVYDFDVTTEFIELVRSTIKKRSIPRDENITVNKETGYIQAGPRVNDYTTFTNYIPGQDFDKDVYNRYLYDVPYEDLEGMTLDKVIEWDIGGLIVFDREQLHASSSCHSRKKFITIFCHGLE